METRREERSEEEKRGNLVLPLGSTVLLISTLALFFGPSTFTSILPCPCFISLAIHLTRETRGEREREESTLGAMTENSEDSLAMPSTSPGP